jgi:hypothetical protein
LKVPRQCPTVTKLQDLSWLYNTSAQTAQKTPLPTVLLLLRHEAVKGPRRKRRFPVSPLVRIRNLLPSNGPSLESHYLATGLDATIWTPSALRPPSLLMDGPSFIVKKNDLCPQLFRGATAGNNGSVQGAHDPDFQGSFFTSGHSSGALSQHLPQPEISCLKATSGWRCQVLTKRSFGF